MRRLISALYGAAYRFKMRLEPWHVPIMVLEILLLGFVVLQVVRAGLEDIHEALDCALCCVLTVILALDLTVRYRHGHRGYSFSRMLARLGLHRTHAGGRERSALLDRLCARSMTGAPALADADEESRKKIIAAIAAESASQFSFRTGRYCRDPEWEDLELRHLEAWAADFPAAIWRTPPIAVSSQGGVSAPFGYFSVVVPIDESSYKDIRTGMMPSLCARVDPRAMTFAAWQFPSPLRLLAYAHVAVKETEDPELMLASSLGHIASLLLRFFPDRGTWHSICNFSIICEVSNASQGDALRMFSFTEVTKHEETVKSPAGFALFEACVSAVTGEGRELLRVIERASPVASSVAQSADPVGLSPPPGSTGMPNSRPSSPPI